MRAINRKTLQKNWIWGEDLNRSSTQVEEDEIIDNIMEIYYQNDNKWINLKKMKPERWIEKIDKMKKKKKK